MDTIENKPDLVEAIQREDIILKRAGNNLKGLCPFHAEKTPSFFVFPQKGRFHCFGCGNSGDVIDFVQRLKGLSFKEAVSYLGMTTEPITREQRAAIEQQCRKREAVREFREWERQEHIDQCRLLRCANKAARMAHDRRDLEALARYYHMRTAVERKLDILENGSDEERFELYQSYQRSGENDMSIQKKGSREVEV